MHKSKRLAWVVAGMLTLVLVIGGAICEAASNNTSLKKSKSHYYVRVPVVTLALGYGAIADDKTFLDQAGLTSEFHQFLNESFSQKNIQAVSEEEADGVVDIELHYTRKFNWGGKALNRPAFWYTVTITKAGEPLASYQTPEATTKYAYFKEVAVNAQIAAFKWGVEDEPKDIELIAQIIAKEVSNIGK